MVSLQAEFQWHSTRTDTIQIWSCGRDRTAAELAEDLNREVVPYFRWLSNNRYDLRFVPGGNTCEFDDVSEIPSSQVAGTGAIFVIPGTSGSASPGMYCTNPSLDCAVATWQETGRYGWVGDFIAFHSLLVHELGHMIHWPHIYSGCCGDYEDPADVMSLNYGDAGTHPDPYATNAIKRYAAGWISPSQVVVHGSGTQTVDLRTPGSGTQMIIVRDTTGYFVLTSRVRSTFDPIPTAWQGVTVHKVLDHRDESQPGDRRMTQWPQAEVGLSPDEGKEHIIPVGGSRTLAGVTVRVTDALSGGYRLTLSGTATGGTTDGGDGGEAGCSGTFTDVCDDNVFFADIEWLAASGITRGCNPPANDEFCPTRTVTRGQMAAFMVRALDLTDVDPSATFTDVPSDHVFRTDIARLATAGITRGCNPPANDHFCPDRVVTRAQMAAFMARAFELVDNDGKDFTDVASDHVFRTDIQKLATAGITRGCNPPDNTRYCPNDPVTRQQMAAFFRRAPLP